MSSGIVLPPGYEDAKPITAPSPVQLPPGYEHAKPVLSAGQIMRQRFTPIAEREQTPQQQQTQRQQFEKYAPPIVAGLATTGLTAGAAGALPSLIPAAGYSGAAAEGLETAGGAANLMQKTQAAKDAIEAMAASHPLAAGIIRHLIGGGISALGATEVYKHAKWIQDLLP